MPTSLESGLLNSLHNYSLLSGPLSKILRTLLPQVVGDIAHDPLVRQALIAAADRALLAQVPAAVFIPATVRERFISQTIDLLLGAMPAAPVPVPEGVALAEAVAEVPAAAAPLPAGSSGLGVRAITVQAAAGADAAAVEAAVDLPGDWGFEKVEGLDDFYTLRPPSPTTLTVSEAWDLAAHLKTLPAIASAEPAIRQLPESAGAPAADVREAVFLEQAFLPQVGMQDHKVPQALADQEWSLAKTFAKAAWPAGQQGKGVLIGHVDTGYTDHPEIRPNILTTLGYDTWDDDADARDDLSPSFVDYLRATFPKMNPSHGTGTASIIASPVGLQPGYGDEKTKGVTGTAPLASIIPIRATPTVVILPTGSADEVAKGILKAVQRGAKVISMSLGSPWPATDLGAAVDKALAAGVIVCAAAGNVVLLESWLTWVTYPAAYPGVVAVAGCDYFYRPWRDSCRGPQVVVTAPGTDVWRAHSELKKKSPDFSTGSGSGTSFAVATTAGIAACWLNAQGGWNALLQKLGGVPSRIPDAFLRCLHAHKATPLNMTKPEAADYPHFQPGYPDFDAKDFGVGVINVEELLKVDPLTAPAVPMLAVEEAALPASEDIVALIQHAFPGLERPALEHVLAADLNLAPGALPGFLARSGRELLHHIATSGALRQRLHELTSKGAETKDFTLESVLPGPAGTTSLATHLQLNSSKTLKADLP